MPRSPRVLRAMLRAERRELRDPMVAPILGPGDLRPDGTSFASEWAELVRFVVDVDGLGLDPTSVY